MLWNSWHAHSGLGVSNFKGPESQNCIHKSNGRPQTLFSPELPNILLGNFTSDCKISWSYDAFFLSQHKTKIHYFLAHNINVVKFHFHNNLMGCNRRSQGLHVVHGPPLGHLCSRYYSPGENMTMYKLTMRLYKIKYKKNVITFEIFYFGLWNDIQVKSDNSLIAHCLNYHPSTETKKLYVL